MTFENISKRRLAFAPKLVMVPDAQEELRVVLHETDYSHTEQIHAPLKMVHVASEALPGTFDKLPALELIVGHLALAESVTLLASKLTRIEGDLHVNAGAKFYAPLLEEVSGFIYIGNGGVVNAPKIEQLLSNDDTSKIKDQANTDWLSTI